MFDANSVFAFILAAVILTIVPGPTVSLILANSLRFGARAGLLNVVGTQMGLATMVFVLAFGLNEVMALMGDAFVYVKLTGAAYLAYLGIKLLLSDGALPQGEAASRRSSMGGVTQGFFVIWSNPKALLFSGAFIPQFVKADYAAAPQVIVYGLLFMVVTTVLDSAYVGLADRAGALFTRSRIRLAERIAGCALLAGAAWLVTARRA